MKIIEELTKKEDLYFREYENLIIQTEAVLIDNKVEKQLTMILIDFCLNHSDSSDPETIVAVCAAIRKVCAIMPDDNGKYILFAGLMSDTKDISVRLETAKVLYRYYSKNHSKNETRPYLELVANQLVRQIRFCSDKSRFKLRFYGSTVLNSVLALKAINSSQFEPMKQHVVECTPIWFKELLKRRLAKMEG